MRESNIKVVIVGCPSAGKTCLWNRLTIRQCPYEEDWLRHKYRDYNMDIVEGHITYKLTLWDTAAETEESSIFRPLLYLTTDVIILCFALDSSKSYQQILEKYLHEVKKYLPNTPIILVGTKTDLEPQITRMERELLRTQVKPYSYVECSPLKGTGRKAILDAIVNAYNKNTAKKKILKQCILM